jgi:hypothetical protein
LGIIGIPHEESIAKFNPTKTCPKRRNRRNPTKNTSNPRTRKTPKSSPFGRGITAQRTTKGSHKFPPSNPQEKGSENNPRKNQERALKITTKNNREQHKKALREPR